MLDADDERLATLLRAIRRRSSITQANLAHEARVPRYEVLRVEGGRAGLVRLDRLRRIFLAAGARARLSVWWHGAAADRLIDARHAALVERTVAVLQRQRWQTAVEVSFSEFGERGSVDILAGRPTERVAAVIEVKSTIGSLEETNRMLDVKERLAPGLARARFGWRPDVVARILVVPDDSTVRRLVARHGLTMASVYPARSREVRAWLRHPTGPLHGLWFQSEGSDPIRSS